MDDQEKKEAPEIGESLLQKEAVSEDALFDGLIAEIGNDGRFQTRFNWIFNFALVALMTMTFLNLVLAVTIPGHNCHVPGKPEEMPLAEWQKKNLPSELSSSGVEILSSCKMFNGSDIVDCMYGWDFDRQWYKSTAPSEESWVCGKELYVTNVFVVSRIAEIVGIFTFGQLGDKIGRKPVFYIALSLLLIGRTSSAFASHNYSLFLTTVAIGSLASVAVFQTPLVIGLEVSADAARAHIGFMQCVGWVLGNSVMPLLTWVIGDWKWMMVATTLPTITAFLVYRLIPESPRWLASQGRVEGAIRSLKHIARVNGTKMPANTTKVLEKIAAKKEATYGIASLFSNWRLAKCTLMIIICWVVCGLSYYSLLLNISNMAGNPFMNFFWQSLVELPGYVIGRFLSNSAGRRWTHTGSYVVGATLCAAVILSHGMSHWATTIFVTCVKFSFTVSFYMVWLQAMEIYPTCVRQTGTSIGGLVANIFGVLGPYVIYLGTSVDSRLPYVVLLGLAVLGFICSSQLPETLNKKLPDTLEEARSFGTEQKFWSFNKTKS